jgi:CheY-like chemotaxis protein
LSVLVVDDVADTANSLAEVLSLYGFATQAVTNGWAALAYIARSPPDAIILDLKMPDMSGWELARHVRDGPAGNRPLIIAVTGCATATDRERSVVAGIDLHMIKPIDPSRLVDTLNRFARFLPQSAPPLAHPFSPDQP